MHNRLRPRSPLLRALAYPFRIAGKTGGAGGGRREDARFCAALRARIWGKAGLLERFVLQAGPRGADDARARRARLRPLACRPIVFYAGNRNFRSLLLLY